jgi:hypothetical protein
LSAEFPKSTDSFPKVYMTWGIGELDTSTAEKWDDEVYGEISFDDEFNPATPAA